MDKFTKTTEVDISNMNAVEDETPQKSKVGKIIAIVISLLLAISIWLYATSKTTVEKVYTNIDVVITNAPENFNIIAESVSVTLVGTNSQLVDTESTDIEVIVDASKIDKVGEHEMIPAITIKGDSGAVLKDKTILVTLIATEKK